MSHTAQEAQEDSLNFRSYYHEVADILDSFVDTESSWLERTLAAEQDPHDDVPRSRGSSPDFTAPPAVAEAGVLTRKGRRHGGLGPQPHRMDDTWEDLGDIVPPLAEGDINSLQGYIRGQISTNDTKTHEPRSIVDGLEGTFPLPTTSHGKRTHNEVINLLRTYGSYGEWHQPPALPAVRPSSQTLHTAEHPSQALTSTLEQFREIIHTRKCPGKKLSFPETSWIYTPEESQAISKPIMPAQEKYCRVLKCSRHRNPFSTPCHTREHEQTHLRKHLRKRFYCSEIGCTRLYLSRNALNVHKRKHRQGRKMNKERSN